MALPKQIQQQIKDVERITGEMEKTQAAASDDSTPPVEEQEIAATASEEQEAPSSEETGLRFDGEQSESEVVQEQEAPSDDGFEHKYKTLQGMFNSEKRANEELLARINSLEGMLAKVQEPREAAAEPEQKPTPDAHVSKEEYEEYGSDLIDVMKRAAREAVQEEMSTLRQENQQLKQVIGGVGQRQEMSDRERFLAQLTTRVSEWKMLNNDPGFNNWLAEEDVYAGEPRKALLLKAFNVNDVERVARFFTGYLNETAAVQQATTEPTPKPNGKGKVKLESLAAPGVGGSGSADNTSKGADRMWKASDIRAFYEAARKQQFAGRDDEYRRIEQQIQTAMQQGRVLVGQ
jgi:hypothetical protein